MELNNNMVTEMRSQGLDDNQIVHQLRQNGYSAQQIFDALSMAEIQPKSQPPEMTGMTGKGMPPPPGSAPQPAIQNVTSSNERIHEIAEVIINEKWDELIGDIQQMAVWKQSIEKQLETVTKDISSVKEDLKNLQQSVIGKIGEYDKHMENVSTQLGAVERVFKDTIPQFTENVHALERYTSKLHSPHEEERKEKKKLEDF